MAPITCATDVDRPPGDVFAYITDNPLRRLEAGERPRPIATSHRALGQDEIAALLAGCPARYRLLLITALYTGTIQPLCARHRRRKTSISRDFRSEGGGHHERG
jgi:hypothetical protein